jgi:hypothetical protein
MSETPYVLFYVTRSATGTPRQLWAPGVYLKDHWEICWSRDEAICQYEKLFTDGCEDVHSAGIAPIDPEYKTDWC